MKFLHNTKIDFLGKKFFAIGLSLILVVASIGFITVEGLHLGIDFVGGNLIQLKYQNAPKIETIRATLAEVGYAKAILQADQQRNEVMIRVEREEIERVGAKDESAAATSVQEHVVDRVVEALTPQEDKNKIEAGKLDLNMVGKDRLTQMLVDKDPLGYKEAENLPPTMTPERYARSRYEPMATMLIDDYREQRFGGVFVPEDFDTAVAGLRESFPELKQGDNGDKFEQELRDSSFLGPFGIIRAEMVSAVVGAELGEQALWAMIFSLGGILVYIWLRFNPRFSIAAIIALIHDVIITVGVFTITGREFNLPIVAAVLTIVGYSLNDTIVIFVRIRENLNIMRREAKDNYEGVLNYSINQTLIRTLLTSLTTLMVVLFLFFLGGSVINDFAFTLIIGVVVGTYSSIFVASPLLSIWQKITGTAGGALAQVKYAKARR